MRSARLIAARAPAMSVPRPVISGQRLAASNPAASASARSSGAGLPPIHALAISLPAVLVAPLGARGKPDRHFRTARLTPIALRSMGATTSLLVFPVSQGLILFRRSFRPAPPPGRLASDRRPRPLGELEVLVGDPLG